MEQTEAVVVGSGPAGGALASLLAKEGFEVILIEKRPRIGIPVRCAEATGSRRELSRFIPIDEDWISADINAARLIAPGGAIIEKHLPGMGVVLDRSRFDQSLADQARRLGADVRPSTEAIGLLRDGDFIRGIQVRDHVQNRTYHIKAEVTVGADGIEGFVGRWAGLTGHLNAGEIHSAIQYLLEADGVPRDTIEIYAGQEIAPGGYAWVFPKGNGLGNVGLGAHPQMLKTGTTKDYLERFIAQHFPKARIWATIAGGTSGTEPLKTMVGNGVLLVGEAARQNNPFSGGGIMNALEGAEEAAFVIAEALKARDLSAGFLRRYDRRWTKRAGHTLSRFALLRRFFFRLDDREMDSVAGVLEGMVQKSEEGVADYAEMFKAAFKMSPGLLWKARKFLW